MATPAKIPRVLPPARPSGVGFVEARLDPVIEASIESLSAGTHLVQEMIPTLRKLWKELKPVIEKLERDSRKQLTKKGGYQGRRDLMHVVKLVEKISKAMSFNSQVTDSLARLRALASGAPDSRREVDVLIDVTGKGETELVELMLQAAAQSGKLCPACTRIALNGRGYASQIESAGTGDGHGSECARGKATAPGREGSKPARHG